MPTTFPLSRTFTRSRSAVAGAVLSLWVNAAGADEGAQLYTARCAGCHQANGAGVVGHFPPLNNLGNWLGRADGRAYMTAAVVNGPFGEIQVGGQNYRGIMPQFSWRLKDAEIVAILRYVGETLNTSAPGYQPFTESMVTVARTVPDDKDSMMAIRAKLPPR